VIGCWLILAGAALADAPACRFELARPLVPDAAEDLRAAYVRDREPRWVYLCPRVGVAWPTEGSPPRAARPRDEWEEEHRLRDMVGDSAASEIRRSVEWRAWDRRSDTTRRRALLAENELVRSRHRGALRDEVRTPQHADDPIEAMEPPFVQLGLGAAGLALIVHRVVDGTADDRVSANVKARPWPPGFVFEGLFP
jgi:hypothetical protein